MHITQSTGLGENSAEMASSQDTKLVFGHYVRIPHHLTLDRIVKDVLKANGVISTSEGIQGQI